MKHMFFSPAVRQFAYFTTELGLTYLHYFFARIMHESTYKEGGIIENIQIVILLFSAMLFAIIWFKLPKFRILSFCFCCLSLLGVCRELDSYFDHVFFVSWKIGFLFLTLAVAYFVRNMTKGLAETCSFINTPSFVMMCNAMIIILAIGQLIGHNSFIQNVLTSHDHINKIKEMFEECLETYGYLLILCSAVELLFQCIASKNSEKEPHVQNHIK